MLSSPLEEFPEFPAAIATLPLLDVDDALRCLEARLSRLDQALAHLDAELASVPEALPRLFLLEEEYRRALWVAERDWVAGILADLREGRLHWSPEWLAEISAALSSL
ncbi:hypothetical protein D3C72_1640150 [compost metagenome]